MFDFLGKAKETLRTALTTLLKRHSNITHISPKHHPNFDLKLPMRPALRLISRIGVRISEFANGLTIVLTIEPPFELTNEITIELPSN